MRGHEGKLSVAKDKEPGKLSLRQKPPETEEKKSKELKGENSPLANVKVLENPSLSHPANLAPRIQAITSLQQQYGNQFVQRLLQTKLRIGQPGDIYEREADRVAEQVMKMPEPEMQRQIEEEEEEQVLYPKELRGGSPEVTPNLEARINAIRGGGQPLPKPVRAFFEPRFGHDFGRVRIHTDTRAAEVAQAANAQALTAGRNVVFGTGQYAPGTGEGRRLLAHELTHTIQQSGKGVTLCPPAPSASAGEPVRIEARRFREQTRIEEETVLAKVEPARGHRPAAAPNGAAGIAPAIRSGSSIPMGRAYPGVVQRIIAIGGTDLDAAEVTSTQNDIVTIHLVDIVNNTSGTLLFTNSYRENLIRDTILDMHEASARFQYGSVDDLARDVRQRVLASLYMRQSQGRTRSLMGFSYPDRASDGTAGVGPRVNEAALSPVAYWGPVQDPAGDYYFELTADGRADAHQAIVKLFAEQSNPHLRTLIHCDYLLGVLQYRAWAESLGVSRFNEGVSTGLIAAPVLKWNGFADLERRTFIPTPGIVPVGIEVPLQAVTVASEDDLIIGDHVVFYNHESYDALIEGVGGIWRLENAIVIDRRGGENRYQGHGYFAPVTKNHLLAGMIRQYNRHVTAARQLTRAVDRATTASQRTMALSRLHADYPNVYEKLSGGWEIDGEGFCGTFVTRDLRPLTMGEAPGLTHPCSGNIRARRPIHTTP